MATSGQDGQVEEDSRFRCGVCGEIFETENQIMEHLAKHLDGHDSQPNTNANTDDRPYKCTECSQTYALMVQLEQHLEGHSGKTERPYKCNECGQTLEKALSLEQHVYGHIVDRQTYPCPICSKKFRKMQPLKKHLQTCKGKKVYPCTECGKILSTEGRLKQHMVCHAKKNFDCEMCFKSFARECDLKQHQKYHPKKEASS